MEALGEWCFAFQLRSKLAKTTHRQHADRLHMAAVKWAEEHGLGVGGGFTIHNERMETVSQHRFGLTTVGGDEGGAEELIAPETAEALLALLRSLASDFGMIFRGECRAFSDAEFPPL